MSKSDVKNNVVVEEKSSTLPASTQPGGNIVVGSIEDQFGDMAGAGLENVRLGQDTLIPRLSILQHLSPQVKKNKPEYIEGAEVGMFCDVGLQQLMPKPLLFIPVYFMTQYLEWAPNRGGLKGIHNSPDILAQCRPNDKRQPVLANGNLIAETAQFYGLNVAADYRLSFIGMTSTQLKKARRWNTLATQVKATRRNGEQYTPALFYHAYELSTVSESNDQGDWEGWKIEYGPRLIDMEARAGQMVFELAKTVYENIKSGRARADLASMGEEAERTTKDDRM